MRCFDDFYFHTASSLSCFNQQSAPRYIYVQIRTQKKGLTRTSRKKIRQKIKSYLSLSLPPYNSAMAAAANIRPPAISTRPAAPVHWLGVAEAAGVVAAGGE